MTPEERNLVIELFDRLATLEDAQRDPEAERLIRDGLRQAPNAPYALVQTVLVQDDALKRADARIRELEGAAAARGTSFLGGDRRGIWPRADGTSADGTGRFVSRHRGGGGSRHDRRLAADERHPLLDGSL